MGPADIGHAVNATQGDKGLMLKQGTVVHTLFALCNLWMARRLFLQGLQTWVRLQTVKAPTAGETWAVQTQKLR